jgi:soluble lytic murein transglycosylase-like protein
LSFGYAGRPHGKLISSYAKANGIPESLAHAVITVESNYRATCTRGGG